MSATDLGLGRRGGRHLKLSHFGRALVKRKGSVCITGGDTVRHQCIDIDLAMINGNRSMQYALPLNLVASERR